MTTAADGLSFGPFHLVVSERLLTKEGAPFELGSRALDILIVLLSTPNEVISKKDLMSRVWPDVIVEEGSLRFHMAGLRKALGDGKDGARYITTLPGRGYCFVAPVSRPGGRRDGAPVAAVNFPHANLPNRLSRMVGRDEDVLKLSAQLNSIALRHHRRRRRRRQNHRCDRGRTSPERGLQWRRCSSSISGCSSDPRPGDGRRGVHAWADRFDSDDARPSLMAYLRDKRILLILDTCEHLVDAVAPLVASIIEAAPQVHILTTSREALRIDGERVYRLDALACPPDDPEMTAAAVLFVSGHAVVHGARGSQWRASGSRRCGSAHRREHLPKAGRRGARARTGGQTG